MPVVDLGQFRNGTAALWTSTDPVLSLGEPGFESDTRRLKIGDGSTAWASLATILAEPTAGSVTVPKLSIAGTPTASSFIGYNGTGMEWELPPSGTSDAYYAPSRAVFRYAVGSTTVAEARSNTGTVLDTGTDHETVLQAAIDYVNSFGNIGGAVLCGPGQFNLSAIGASGKVICSGACSIVGQGMRATTFLMTAATAGIQFGSLTVDGGRRGLSGHFLVNGGNVATKPVSWGLGAENNYLDIGSLNSVDCGFYFQSTQNAGLWGFFVDDCARGVVFDGAPKNISLYRGTIADCNVSIHFCSEVRHPSNVINPTQLKHPEHIHLTDVLVEPIALTGDSIGMKVSAGRELYFNGGALNVDSDNGIGLLTDLADPAGSGATLGQIFLDGQISGGSGTSTAIKSVTSADIHLLPRTIIGGVGTTYDIQNSGTRIYEHASSNTGTAVTSRLVLSGSAVGRVAGQIISRNAKFRPVNVTAYSSTNATTFVNATELILYTVVAGSVWEFKGVLLIDGSTTGDFMLGWTTSGVAAGAMSWHATDHLGVTTYGSATTSTVVVPTLGVGTTSVLRIQGTLTALASGSPGNLTPRFHQNVADGANASRILIGSSITYERVYS